MEYGLLGQSLGHSYSPMIHSYFGDYSYSLFEKDPEVYARLWKRMHPWSIIQTPGGHIRAVHPAGRREHHR